MINLIKFSILTTILIGATCNISLAQNQDISWIYGIWGGVIGFANKEVFDNPNLYDEDTVDFRMNEEGFTVKFKYRERNQCQVEWILEEINEKTAKFREKVIKNKPKTKSEKTSKMCLDGGTLVFQRGQSNKIIYYSYYLPNSNTLSGRGFLSSTGPRYGTDEYDRYYAVKVGGFTVDRQYLTEIKELGLKVGDIKFPLKKRESTKSDDITFDHPIVVAVQEGSPAFYAGIVPGDIIVSLGDRWSLKNTGSFVEEVDRMASAKISDSLMVDYEVSDSPYVQSTGVTIPFNNSNERGKWITEVLIHQKNARALLPGVKESNETAKNLYSNYEKEVFSIIKTNPCRINSNRISDMANKLNELAIKSGDIGEGENRKKHLTETVEAVCENTKDGGLTKFESVLLAIVFRRIDPCKYSPSIDYSNIFNNSDSIKYYSKKGYNYYFSRRLNIQAIGESKQSCFDKIVRSAFDLPN